MNYVTLTLTIDWAELRIQKDWLCSQLKTEGAGRPVEGLLNLLDYIQDRAVDQGLSEDLVFGVPDDGESEAAPPGPDPGR